MRRITIVAFLIISYNVCAQCQQAQRYEINAGIGYYETLTIGGRYILKKPEHKIGLSVGYDPDLIQSGKNITFSLEHDLAIFRSEVKDNRYKWHLENKIVYWHLNDSYYKWDVVSFIPSISRNFYLAQRFYLSVDAGPSFNLVLRNVRLTYKEVGWPYHVYPNARLQLNYVIR